MSEATDRAGWKKRLDRLGGTTTMWCMDKTHQFSLRISTRERAKIAECSQIMGVSAGEFTRRCIQIMLMVMGDKESKSAIHQILDAAIITGGAMKMGAGLAPVPPKPMESPRTPLRRKGRKEKAGR
jgi:hypothetical protein